MNQADQADSNSHEGSVCSLQVQLWFRDSVLKAYGHLSKRTVSRPKG